MAEGKLRQSLAGVLAVLAIATIGVDVWAFSVGLDGLPLWIWLTSVVCASLALVGAVAKFISEILA
jgi:hypothetical protein